jgi:CBS domain-containing protein
VAKNIVNCIKITKNNYPKRIITDKDIRTKIGTSLFSVNKKMTKNLSSPVITFSEKFTVTEA